MQTRTGSAHQPSDGAPLQREVVHEVPNPLGIVASAKPQFAVFGEAGMRGGQLLPHLLATDPAARDLSLVDIGARLADLAPMLRAAAGARISLHADVAILHSRVRMVREEFDAVILALIAHALAAGASNIAVRNHVVGARVWILVSDDGRGMCAPALATSRSGEGTESTHGGGLSRVHRFARMTHGKLLVRSCPGVGTSTALILPTMLSAGAPCTSAFLKPKETIDEKDRQRTAA